jgi:hypothetical protein
VVKSRGAVQRRLGALNPPQLRKKRHGRFLANDHGFDEELAFFALITDFSGRYPVSCTTRVPCRRVMRAAGQRAICHLEVVHACDVLDDAVAGVARMSTRFTDKSELDSSWPAGIYTPCCRVPVCQVSSNPFHLPPSARRPGLTGSTRSSTTAIG